MAIAKEIAKQMRQMYNGPSFVGGDLAKALEGVDWEMSNRKVGQLNNISLLLFHINYYMDGVIRAFKTGKLDIRDKYSFDMEPIDSNEAWEALKKEAFTNGEEMASIIENMDDQTIKGDFLDGKYGSMYSNMSGMLNHSYYHIGQIAIISKRLKEEV